MLAEQVLQIIQTVLTDADNRFGGNLLGTYTLPGGTQIPAIGVEPVQDDLKATGVEVTLPLFPSFGQTEWTGYDVHRQDSWDVMLTQRDIPDEEQPKLAIAVDRLTRFFYLSTGVPIPADDELDNYPGYRLTFQFPNFHPVVNQIL